MESSLKASYSLFQIVLGSTVHVEWTTFLKKIRVLGSGTFGTVYLAEDPSNEKQYVVKEVFT
jgi:serine/threonine protein kinase